ncbi:MAG: hypothetical protein AAGG81_06435 [Chlamydiota bacterium]
MSLDRCSHNTGYSLSSKVMGPTKNVEKREEDSISGYLKSFGIGSAISICYTAANHLRVVGSISATDFTSFNLEVCNFIERKSISTLDLCIIGPIAAEIIFGQLIQKNLLPDISKGIVGRIAPGKESVLNSNVAKVSRAILSAGLFTGTYMFLNGGEFSDSLMNIHALDAVIFGIVLGLIRESGLGLAGAVGGHIAHDTLATALLSC